MKLKLGVLLLLNIQAAYSAQQTANPSKHGLEDVISNEYKDGEDIYFTKEEYANYLKRIELLDPKVHDILMPYNLFTKKPAFFKAQNKQKGTVLLPLPLPHFPSIPRMILPENLSDEELENYLRSFRALLEKELVDRRSTLDFATDQQKKYSDKFLEFPDIEYTHYMKLIGIISPIIQKQLQETEQKWWQKKAIFKDPSDKKINFKWLKIGNCPNFYLFVILPSFKGKPKKEKEKILKTILVQYSEQYKQYLSLLLTQDDINRCLRILNELSPEIYKAIIDTDPNGTNHIQSAFDNNPASIKIAPDGLPLMLLEKHFLDNFDDKSLGWILAHELGHYAHEDLVDTSHLRLRHKGISLTHEGPKKRSFMTSSGKTIHVIGKLDPKQTLKNRQQNQWEYAADAFTIKLNISLEHIKEIFPELVKTDVLQPKIFMRTHPLGIRKSQSSNPQLDADIASFGRIKYMELEATRVKELRAQGKQPAPVDWSAIIAAYKKTIN